MYKFVWTQAFVINPPPHLHPPKKTTTTAKKTPKINPKQNNPNPKKHTWMALLLWES